MHASTAGSLHEARSLENTDVLGDSLERHIERLRELGHCLFCPRDPAQNRPPRRMGQGPKNAIEVLVATVNHEVEYQLFRMTVNQEVECQTEPADSTKGPRDSVISSDTSSPAEAARRVVFRRWPTTASWPSGSAAPLRPVEA